MLLLFIRVISCDTQFKNGSKAQRKMRETWVTDKSVPSCFHIYHQYCTKDLNCWTQKQKSVYLYCWCLQLQLDIFYSTFKVSLFLSLSSLCLLASWICFLHAHSLFPGELEGYSRPHIQLINKLKFSSYFS